MPSPRQPRKPYTRPDGEPTRQRLLAALAELSSRGQTPTFRELAVTAGVSPSNVRHHLAALQAAGLISIRKVPTIIYRHEIVLLEGSE